MAKKQQNNNDDDGDGGGGWWWLWWWWWLVVVKMTMMGNINNHHSFCAHSYQSVSACSKKVEGDWGRRGRGREIGEEGDEHYTKWNI